MKNQIILTGLLVLNFNIAFADMQTLVCTGVAASGNSYKVTIQADDADSRFTTASGTRIFDAQNIELEKFDSSGNRIMHHNESITNLIVNSPSEKFSNYTYGADQVLIAGFGQPHSVITLNVGAFQGVSLSNADCKIKGAFNPNFVDTASQMVADSQRSVREAKEETKRFEREAQVRRRLKVIETGSEQVFGVQ